MTTETLPHDPDPASGLCRFCGSPSAADDCQVTRLTIQMNLESLASELERHKAAHASEEKTIADLKAENAHLQKLVDEASGAARDTPISGMTEEEVRKFANMALLNLAEAVRHIAEAGLVRGGKDYLDVALRPRLNVARAASYLDGRVWKGPKDVKG